jgi:hypothetical protein
VAETIAVKMNKRILFLASSIFFFAALSAAQGLQFEVASIKLHPRAQGRGSVVPQALRLEPTRLWSGTFDT